jgi:hypothetical protein
LGDGPRNLLLPKFAFQTPAKLTLMSFSATRYCGVELAATAATQ